MNQLSGGDNLPTMLAFDNVSDGVVAVNAELTILYINPVAGHLTGFDPAKAVGSPLAELLASIQITTSDSEASVDRELSINALLDTKESVKITGDILRVGDSERPAKFEGTVSPITTTSKQPVAVIVFRKLADSPHHHGPVARPSDLPGEIVDLHNRNMRLMIEQVRDYAVFLTDAECRATSWNVGVQSVLGFSEEEFIGLDIRKSIFTEEDQEAGIPEWEMETARRSGSCTDDRWMLRNDGTTFWASGITTSLENETGEVIGFSKIMRDLTHRKDADNAIRRLNQELSEADRQKSAFLATLGHELRNPLSPVTTAIVLMMAEDDLSENMMSLCKVMQRQVNHIVRLVDDLLDISRIGRGEIDVIKVACRLQPTIQLAVESLQPRIAEMTQSLFTDVPLEPIFLHADPNRLAQVFANLLNNSAKFTPADGEIRLVVRIKENAVVVTVTDNGVGIESDKLASIFEMYAQADSSLESGKAGLGIGLSLVKTLVELHDGTIDVYSEGLAMGTKVTIELPTIEAGQVDRQADHKERLEDRDENNQQTSCKVLVVDDVPAIRFTLSRVIEELGHDVQASESAMGALKKIPEFQPDVIFSDISMPGLSGFEFASELRRKFPDNQIHLVALTGFGAERERQRAIDAGFDTHMTKPPDAKVLSTFFQSLK